MPFVLGTALKLGDTARGVRRCVSGLGVARLRSAGSPIREAMLSGMRSGVDAREYIEYSVFWVYSVSGVARRWRAEEVSGEGDRDRRGYSVAGVARRRREVVGCGERMVGAGYSSVTIVVGTLEGPVRTLEGRICSKPSERAT